MPRKARETDHYDDDFESDDQDYTDTLISRNKPPRAKTAPVKKTKKSTRRPGSPNKARAKTGKELWMAAIKKRQTGPANGRLPDSPRHKTPIEYWVDTLRKTGTGMSTESGGLNSLTGLKKTNDMNWAYLSTSHYMRQMMGTEKGKKNIEDPTGKPLAGTPAYKSPEEYYDQILELKKHITSLSQDNSTMKAKVRRLEEDNIKKEKEIDGLLHPEKNEELRRTMGDRKPDTGAVIHSLKQKILKLEMQLRDKEASYVKLASELKTTKVEEMRIQQEVLYQEVLRLQNSQVSGVDKSRPGKESSAKVKALNETVIRLSKTNEQLQVENKGLKEDLDKALEDTEGDKSTARREYEDMNKRQLLATIAKAERRAERAEKKLEMDTTSMLSFDSRRSEVQGKITLQGTLEERLHQLDQRETELLEEVEKLKLKIKRLSSDRSRNRSGHDSHTGTPRTPPAPTPRRRRKSSFDASHEAKVDSFSQKRAATRIQQQWRENRSRKQAEEELQQPIQDQGQNNGTAFISGRFLAGTERIAIQAQMLRRKNAARTIQRGWKEHSEEKERMQKANNFRKNHAAKAIQNRWRQHHRDEEDNQAAYLIQSALRGHHRRRKELQRHRAELEDDYDDEDYSTGSDDAVYMIQSSLKGHKARKDKLRRMRLDSTGEEDDYDDGYHGLMGSRRSSMARRPPSAQSRGSLYKRTTYATYPSKPPSVDDDDDIMF